MLPTTGHGPNRTAFKPHRPSEGAAGNRNFRLTGVVAALATLGPDAGLYGDNRDDQCDERVCPPETEEGVGAEHDEDREREVGAEDVRRVRVTNESLPRAAKANVTSRRLSP